MTCISPLFFISTTMTFWGGSYQFLSELPQLTPRWFACLPQDPSIPTSTFLRKQTSKMQIWLTWIWFLKSFTGSFCPSSTPSDDETPHPLILAYVYRFTAAFLLHEPWVWGQDALSPSLDNSSLMARTGSCFWVSSGTGTMPKKKNPCPQQMLADYQWWEFITSLC